MPAPSPKHARRRSGRRRLSQQSRYRSNPLDVGQIITPVVAFGAVALAAVLGWSAIKESSFGKLLGLGGSNTNNNQSGGGGIVGDIVGGVVRGVTGGSGGSSSGSSGSQSNPATQPGATQCGWSQIAGHPGNTHLSFDVNPPNPPKQEGATVVYTGRLTVIDMFGLHEVGINGARIDFVDGGNCTVFQSVITDKDGVYRLERPLQADELAGYYVFAVYQADERLDQFGQFRPGRAATYAWTVTPRG